MILYQNVKSEYRYSLLMNRKEPPVIKVNKTNMEMRANNALK